MKDIIRMNQLAGIITEGQARKMLEVLNENIKLDNFKELLNRFHNDKMVSLEDLGNAFKKLNSEDQEEAFEAIENSESDYILDDNEFYAFAGWPVR